MLTRWHVRVPPLQTSRALSVAVKSWRRQLTRRARAGHVTPRKRNKSALLTDLISASILPAHYVRLFDKPHSAALCRSSRQYHGLWQYGPVGVNSSSSSRGHGTVSPTRSHPAPYRPARRPPAHWGHSARDQVALADARRQGGSVGQQRTKGPELGRSILHDARLRLSNAVFTGGLFTQNICDIPILTKSSVTFRQQL